MPPFSFRLRIILAPIDAIGFDTPHVDLALPGLPAPVRLSSDPKTLPLKDAKALVFIGHGYETEETAVANGTAFSEQLRIALARLGMGADFGDSERGSFVTDHGLRVLEAEHGGRLLRDKHGLMTYESEPVPRFVSANSRRRTWMAACQSHWFSGGLMWPVFAIFLQAALAAAISAVAWAAIR